MNVQIIADPLGRLLWASPALPGSVHDLRAAREHRVVDALAEADIPCWGRREMLSAGWQAVNRCHAKIRALVEQAVATLKSWRLPRRLLLDHPDHQPRSGHPRPASDQLRLRMEKGSLAASR